MKPVFRLTLTECTEHHTTITVHVQGIKALIHFRGDALWQWSLGMPPCTSAEHRKRKPWIRSHGQRICWAEWLHEGLKGWHTCVLHAGDTLSILPRHPDYDFVARLVHLSQFTDKEILNPLWGRFV